MDQPADGDGGTAASMPPDAQLASLLREQARACETMGSPLYAHLLDRVAEDVERGGVCRTLLAGHLAPGRAAALALRFMAAVHRLVLTGRAPRLAEHYPSVGGTAPLEGAWAAFHATVVERADDVARLLDLPCQTNEVGRAAALAVGFLDVAATTGLPLRCLEVGASAGLNLRWDRFRYGGAGSTWGVPDSPVDLTGLWAEPIARTDQPVAVVERRGCDARPVDPTTPAGRLALTASVWGDQVPRLERLRGALRIAQTVPAAVDVASGDAWTARQLAEPVEGVATVVFQSIVDEYLSPAVRRRFRDAIAAAGARARPQAPLAWMRLEPASALRDHSLALTLWPGGQERVLAICGAHGQDVRAPAGSAQP